MLFAACFSSCDLRDEARPLSSGVWAALAAPRRTFRPSLGRFCPTIELHDVLGEVAAPSKLQAQHSRRLPLTHASRLCAQRTDGAVSLWLLSAPNHLDPTIPMTKGLG